MKKNPILLVLGVGVVLIGGGILVFNLFTTPAETTPVVTAEEVLSTVEQVPPINTKEIVQEPAEETKANTPAVVIPPTPRTELEGTDPSTVNLASGQIQLVEVFSFT